MLTPSRSATSPTLWPRCVTCLTVAILNSSVYRFPEGFGLCLGVVVWLAPCFRLAGFRRLFHLRPATRNRNWIAAGAPEKALQADPFTRGAEKPALCTPPTFYYSNLDAAKMF
jgi:hypothetical protein